MIVLEWLEKSAVDALPPVNAGVVVGGGKIPLYSVHVHIALPIPRQSVSAAVQIIQSLKFCAWYVLRVQSAKVGEIKVSMNHRTKICVRLTGDYGQVVSRRDSQSIQRS